MKDKLAPVEPTLVAWILFDATTDKKYIKMSPADGSLAIFDSEEAAMAAKKLHYGADYKRCEYYSAPAVQGEPEEFCEDTVLSLAERTFSTEVDEQLAEDIIQYARRLHNRYTAPQPAPEVAKLAEAAEMALKEIECALNEAYNNAGSVCCQRPSFGECCGEPDPAWSAADEAIIDRFAPHHRALEEAIRAYRQQKGEA